MSFFSRKKSHHLTANYFPFNDLTVQSTRQQPSKLLSQSHSRSQHNQKLSTSVSPATNGLTTSQSTQQQLQHPLDPPHPPQRPFPTTSQSQSHSPQPNEQLSTPNSPPTDKPTTSQQHPPQQQSLPNTSQSQFPTSNSPRTNGLTSQSQQHPPPQPFPTTSQSQSHSPQANQQPSLLCTWSAHIPQPEPSPSPFPRHCHALTATATTAGELFLFGGYIHDSASDDLYVISTRDLSARQLRARGEVPGPRIGHAAVLTSTILLIWGGKTNFSDQNALNQRQDDSLNFLNLGALCILISKPTPADQSFFAL